MPLRVWTRSSRGNKAVSAAAVTRATTRFSSRAGAASLRVIPPSVDSIVTEGLAIDGAGKFVALKPGSPLKMKPVALPRFSPEIVMSTVVPR